MKMLRLFLLIKIAVGLSVLSDASIAQESSSGSWVTNAAPENCSVFLGWTGEIGIDANGSASEKWLAQKEIQQSVLALQKSLSIYLKENPIDPPEMNDLVAKLPWLLMQQPFAFYIGDMQPPEQASGAPKIELGFAMELGEYEALVAKSIEIGKNSFVKSKNAPSVTKTKIAEREFWKISDKDMTLCLGIADGRFLFAVGEGSMEILTKGLDTPPAPWMTQLLQQNPTERMMGIGHINMTKIWDLMQQQQIPLPKSLHLEEIQGLSSIMDIQPDAMVTTSRIHCPEQTQGLLSVLDVEPLSMGDINEIPAKIDTAAGIRISPTKLWKLIDSVGEETGFRNINVAVQNFEQDSGLDFQNDVLNSFNGKMLSFGKLDLMNPTGSSMFAIGINDPETFKGHLRAINEVIEDEAEFQHQSTYSQFELSGVQVSNLQTGVLDVCWCLVDDQLLVALSRSALRSQLRKRKRSSGKFSEDQVLKGLFAESNGNSNKGDNNPIAISYVDYAKFIQIAVPVMKAGLGNSTPHPDFMFSAQDLPSAQVLANGLKPNYSGVYRDERGFRLVEFSTLPGNASVAVGGVLIGMLLPAVQAVRHAARRTASANNMRQIVLANLNHESAYGSFVTAHTKNESGKKLLSWRVHILPFIEQQALYEQFHLDEPWDSPHNKTLIAKMPVLYANPALPLEEGMTSYLAVTGDDTVIAAPKEASSDGEMKTGVKTSEITDGTESTLLIVDANLDNTVIWTKPDDFVPAEHDNIHSQLSGTWANQLIAAAFVNGSITYLGIEYSEEELHALMTKSDGENVDLNK